MLKLCSERRYKNNKKSHCCGTAGAPTQLLSTALASDKLQTGFPCLWLIFLPTGTHPHLCRFLLALFLVRRQPWGGAEADVGSCHRSCSVLLGWMTVCWVTRKPVALTPGSGLLLKPFKTKMIAYMQVFMQVNPPTTSYYLLSYCQKMSLPFFFSGDSPSTSQTRRNRRKQHVFRTSKCPSSA